MNYRVRSSIKVGLIASAMLVFSACGSEDTAGNPHVPEISAPLFDQKPIEAGDVCEFGGTMVRGGLDKDKDGELSDSEVTSETPICDAKINGEGEGEGENNETPTPPDLLVKTEPLEVGDEACPEGGKRVHVGYDLDGDGELSAAEIADESTKTTDLCHSGPVDACVGAEQLEIVSIELEEDLFGYHEVDRSYEVRIEFNKEVDADAFELKDILKTLGEDALTFTIDPDNNKIAIVEFEGEMNEVYAMAIAANDGCTTGSAGLRTPELELQQTRLNVTYDHGGFSAEGDTVKLCYESRGADTCITTIRNDQDSDADLSKCIEITADADDMAAGSIFANITCHDSAQQHIPAAKHRKLIPTQAAVVSFDTTEFPGIYEPEEFDLQWETFQMESCSLSDGTDSQDVAVNESQHTVLVEETTEYILTCKDADENEYSKTRRVVMGSGILSFDASVTQRAAGFPLSFTANWETHGQYGTCDIEFEYGQGNASASNISQIQDYNLHPRVRLGNVLGLNTAAGVQDLDPAIEGTAKLTCKSSFGGQPDRTLEVVIRTY